MLPILNEETINDVGNLLLTKAFKDLNNPSPRMKKVFYLRHKATTTDTV